MSIEFIAPAPGKGSKSSEKHQMMDVQLYALVLRIRYELTGVRLALKSGDVGVALASLERTESRLDELEGKL